MKKTLFLGAALATSLTAAAFAQTPPGDAPKPPMTRVELQAKIAEQFKLADLNKDGVVTRAEIATARETMIKKMRAEHRDAMFKKLDKDGNGTISKAEFDAAQPPRGGPDGDDRRGPGGSEGRGDRGPGGPGKHGGMGRGHDMRGGPMGHGPMFMIRDGRWFDQADTNKDDKLTLAEASAGALARFDRIDTNKDGKISPEERKAGFGGMRGEWKGRKAD